MLSLPRSMRERAVASLAWRRTAPPGQGISGISRQLPTGQSHSDSRPEKRAPEHLPKAGGIEWSSNFAQKYVFSTLYENKSRLPGALSSKSPITGCAAPLKCVALVGRKLYKNKPGD